MSPSHKTPAELHEQTNVLRDERNRILFDFLLIDLDLSLSFVEAALDYHNDEQKRERNRANARKGYEAVQHFRNRFEITIPQQNELVAKLTKLKSALEQAGEQFEE